MVFARALRPLLTCLTVASALGCGNSSAYVPIIVSVQAIAPSGGSFLSNTIPAGTTSILVIGLFFDSSSVVYVNGKPQKTTFAGDAAIGVPDARAVHVDLGPESRSGPQQLAVTAQGPDTPMSQPFGVAVLEERLQVTNLTPSQVPAGSGDTTVTWTGHGFNSLAQVFIDDATQIPTTFVSTTQLTSVVPAAFLQAAAAHTLTLSEQQNCPSLCQLARDREFFTVQP
jgi:hypothetical protein